MTLTDPRSPSPRAHVAGETVIEPGPRAVVHKGLDLLLALEHEWRRLYADSDCQPSMSFDWTMALARTQLAAPDHCFLVTVRRGDRLVGAVPLLLRATRAFRQAHFLLRPLAELKNTHSDLLIERSPDALRALVEGLCRLDCRWDSVRLSKLVEGHTLTPLIEQASRDAGCIPRRRYRKAAYRIPLPGTFDEYFAARSSKFRNYARRAEKKLRAAGRLDVLEFTEAAAFDEAYDALLHVERLSWKETHGTSMSAVPAQAALFREWGRAAAPAGEVHLQLLMLNGEPIAHNLGSMRNGTYYYLKSSYAARHRPLSPATYLRLRLIRAMIGRGMREVDFCGTPYEWEQQWTETYQWHHVLSVYASTWRGRLLSLVDRWSHYSSTGERIEHEDPRTERP